MQKLVDASHRYFKTTVAGFLALGAALILAGCSAVHAAEKPILYPPGAALLENGSVTVRNLKRESANAVILEFRWRPSELVRKEETSTHRAVVGQPLLVPSIPAHWITIERIRRNDGIDARVRPHVPARAAVPTAKKPAAKAPPPKATTSKAKPAPKAKRPRKPRGRSACIDFVHILLHTYSRATSGRRRMFKKKLTGPVLIGSARPHAPWTSVAIVLALGVLWITASTLLSMHPRERVDEISCRGSSRDAADFLRVVCDWQRLGIGRANNIHFAYKRGANWTTFDQLADSTSPRAERFVCLARITRSWPGTAEWLLDWGRERGEELLDCKVAD